MGGAPDSWRARLDRAEGRLEEAARRRWPAIAVVIERRWMLLTFACWVLILLWSLEHDWNRIRWLSLGDTDDNMRLAQVRAWMAGQGWFDLRQYRLNPPTGFDIHWSRIVDLPLAGLILVFRLFASRIWAEKLACGVAPILPLLPALWGLSATVRRLIHPLAWPLAVVGMLCAGVAMAMFAPERIDHHNWQLAMLSLTVAGLCDPARARGGALVGIATAVSLNIGLEMLPFAGMAGAIIALRWVWDAGEARRLAAYGLTLAGGCAGGFAGFASYANRLPRCDALTPPWLTAMVAAGAALFVLAWWSPARREVRLAAAVAAGAVVGAAFAYAFPQCLGRPEQVSPELARNWLDNVREAKPIFRHPLRMALPVAALPIAGLIGAWIATVLAWRRRAGAARQVGWVSVALFTTFSCAALLWQVRFGPGAQMLAVPGAVALVWILAPWLLGHRLWWVRILGPAVAILLVSGQYANLLIDYGHVDRPSRFTQRVNRATGRCLTEPALHPLDVYPAATIFTFVDLGPRLIVLSHHAGVAGPYHRNGDAILDVQHAFSGSPEQAHAIMRAHGATLLLVCPNMAEATVYRARAPGGFYSHLAHDGRFGWLTPLPLPRGSPLRLFRID